MLVGSIYPESRILAGIEELDGKDLAGSSLFPHMEEVKCEQNELFLRVGRARGSQVASACGESKQSGTVQPKGLRQAAVKQLGEG